MTLFGSFTSRILYVTPNLSKCSNIQFVFCSIILSLKLLLRSAKLALRDRINHYSFSNAKNLIPWLSAEGVLVLAETVPRHTQRLYELLQPAWLSSELLERLKTAEEAIYDDHSNPTINWDSSDLQQDLEKEGLTVKVEQERSQTSILITPTLLERWFGSTQKSEARLTYRRHLEKILTNEEVAVVGKAFTQHLCHQTVTWSSTIAYLKICMQPSNK